MELIPIVIDNTIQLKQLNDYIIVNIRIPERNIQNMLDETNGKLISKIKTSVSFNHNAGQLYTCKVRTSLKSVKNKLKLANIDKNTRNFQEYLKLVGGNNLSNYFNLSVLSNEIVGIYEFGNCAREIEEQTVSYYFANGREIRFNKFFKPVNEGKTRYLKRKKGWVSNKAF